MTLDSQQNSATFSTSFFIEHEQVTGLISTLTSTNGTPNAAAAALAKFRTILDKYLECPTLLDPYLESMVTSLGMSARGIIHEVFLSQNTIGTDDQGNDNMVDEQYNQNDGIELVDKLDTLLHLLSAIYALSKVRGRKFIQKLLPHEVSDVEPVLAMLRWFGWLDRQSVNHDDMSNDNEGNVVQLLKRIQEQQESSMESAKIWESIYSLLNWLGIISLVPFDLHTIDSTLGGTDSNEDETSITLVHSILSTSASHLNDSGPTREAAAACLASLLSRPDLEQSELEGFVTWSARMMQWFRTGVLHEISIPVYEMTMMTTVLHMPQKQPSVFLVMGILQTLAAIFKSGHRSNLLSTQQKLHGIELLWEQSILIAEGSIGSMLLRKLLVKLFARIGCAYLPPRVAAWRYQRGRRSLLENLMMSSVPVVEQSDATCSVREQGETTLDDKYELFLIPDQVEDAMGQLLQSLTDPSTIVRWSSAKGIGRLTERLPAICADDVLDALLSTCADPERDRNWHGACLCLAELARRGLLLPNRLGEIVPIVVKAIGYDIRRGQHSVGAHVRDAACYTCWAFARAYSPEVLRPRVKELSVALVLASLFDREVNCRRAASAAFQESVGRQGADNFKHGIAILTAADYFSLGNRTDAYLNIVQVVAKFEEYQKPILHHLSETKLHHWDGELRALTSQSLARVSRLDPLYCANEILPKLLDRSLDGDLAVRHGSLLGAAEVILALGQLDLVKDNSVLSSQLKLLIVELVPRVEKARLYRGRGGEIMRYASCRMIECISLANIHMDVKQQVRLLDSIDTCLAHPNEDIQQAAARAVKALLTNYFPVSNKGPSQRLQGRVVDKYVSIVKTEDNPAATRGFTLALGSLPSKLLAPNNLVLDSVLDCLCNASRKDCLVGGEGDAETRRNAIVSLINVCQTVGIQNADDNEKKSIKSSPITPLSKQQTLRVFSTLLDATEDYNMDRRGDVGSWSRIVAMKGLETLAFLVIKSSTTYPHSTYKAPQNIYPIQPDVVLPSFSERFSSFSKRAGAQTITAELDCDNIFDETICVSLLSALLKQLGEKLDAVRNQAGECLERLLTNESPRLPFVPYRRVLVCALKLNGKTINWSNPALTFPLLMCAINIEGFLEPILSGIVISVGGLTESVSKSSTAALFEWIRGLTSNKATSKLIQMGEVFLALFRKNKRNGRVLMPLLATLDKLSTHGHLNALLIMKNGEFVDNLLASVVEEAKSCSDIKRLLAIIDVVLNLLQPDLQTIDMLKEKALPFIMKMLLNPYPRVRKYTAEQLFAKLSVDGDSMFDSHQLIEEANQILFNTAWHEESDTTGRISESRNRIADLLGVQLSKEERNAPLVKKQALKSSLRDEFENYSSLVNSTA